MLVLFGVFFYALAIYCAVAVFMRLQEARRSRRPNEQRPNELWPSLLFAIFLPIMLIVRIVVGIAAAVSLNPRFLHEFREMMARRLVTGAIMLGVPAFGGLGMYLMSRVIGGGTTFELTFGLGGIVAGFVALGQHRRIRTRLLDTGRRIPIRLIDRHRRMAANIYIPAALVLLVLGFTLLIIGL